MRGCCVRLLSGFVLYGCGLINGDIHLRGGNRFYCISGNGQGEGGPISWLRFSCYVAHERGIELYPKTAGLDSYFKNRLHTLNER